MKRIYISLSGYIGQNTGSSCKDFICIDKVLKRNNFIIDRKNRRFRYADKVFAIDDMTPYNGPWCASTAISAVLCDPKSRLEILKSDNHWLHHRCVSGNKTIESNVVYTDKLLKDTIALKYSHKKIFELFKQYLGN